jgi:pyridoxamine 5'-phosphate oxidase
MDLKEVKNYLNTKRRDFANRPFTENMAADDPFKQYALWFDEAVSSQLLDPYAACLSTSEKGGQPSSRMVYIRDVINEGFVFYTNYSSLKAGELSANPLGAFNIFWGELERQIRIQGSICKVDNKISDQYFEARPRASKIGAWASAQSEVLANREELEGKINFYTSKFKDDSIPRPPHWGGYCLKPDKIEFWQGRPSRLHDRILYTKQGESWIKSRLSP